MYLGKICEVAPSDLLYQEPAHHYTKVLLDSIPVPDPEVAAQRTAIEGEPPSPVLPPSGCRFNTRCPAADDTCRTVEPQLVDLGHGHYVACHHPLVTPVSLSSQPSTAAVITEPAT
jgi:peptide/nickel transport system ATP-binding protein